MARIVAALIAGHNIEPFREEIDDLAFTLVAPLGAEDDYVSHFDQTYLVYRTRSDDDSSEAGAVKRTDWPPMNADERRWKTAQSLYPRLSAFIGG